MYSKDILMKYYNSRYTLNLYDVGAIYTHDFNGITAAKVHFIGYYKNKGMSPEREEFKHIWINKKDINDYIIEQRKSKWESV